MDEIKLEQHGEGNTQIGTVAGDVTANFEGKNSENSLLVSNVQGGIHVDGKATVYAGAIDGFVSNLPRRNPHFSGRDNAINNIYAEYKSVNWKDTTTFQTLSGFGGVGKTSLAIEYAYRNMHDYPSLIWIINVETEPTTFAGLSALAIRLGLFEDETDCIASPSKVKSSIQSWLQSNGSWLIILENINELAKDTIEEYIPNVSPNGHVLITTRDNQITFGRHEEIDVFSETDAVSFMQKALVNRDDDQFALLAFHLGFYPLALTQVAAYLNNCKLSIQDYLELLKSKGLRIFESKHAKPTDYIYIITTVWETTIEQLSPESKDFLRLCSCLYYEKIPFHLFLNAADCLPLSLQKTMKDNLLLNDMRAELLRYSIIQPDDDWGYFGIHSLLSAVILEGATNNEIMIMLQCMISFLPINYQVKQDFDRFRCVTVHSMVLAYNTEIRYHSHNDIDFEIASNAFQKFSLGFAEFGLLEFAIVNANNAMVFYKLSEINDTKLYISFLNTMAYSLKQYRQFEEAEIFYDEACNLVVVNEQIINVGGAVIFNNAALNKAHLRKCPEAHVLIEKSIAFWESVEDAFCEELGVSYNTFGYIFHIENKIDDSLIFYKKALACKLKAYGEQNVAIANALNNIGDVSLHLDNATAANYYQKAKNIYMAVQGETHPNVAKMDISIACALNNMDLYEIAKQHLKDAFEILVPLSHPEIERASIIANAVYYVGKYKMPIKDWIASLLPKGYGIQLSEVDTNDLLKKPW